MLILKMLLGGIGTFLLAQTGLLIWHLSRMNTTLFFIRADVERAMKDMDAKKTKHDNDIATVWKRIDEHSGRITVIEQKCRLTHTKDHSD